MLCLVRSKALHKCTIALPRVGDKSRRRPLICVIYTSTRSLTATTRSKKSKKIQGSSSLSTVPHSMFLKQFKTLWAQEMAVLMENTTEELRVNRRRLLSPTLVRGAQYTKSSVLRRFNLAASMASYVGISGRTVLNITQETLYQGKSDGKQRWLPRA